MSLELIEQFSKYFTLKAAATDAEREKIFALRYKVYCEEFKFEEASRFETHQEKDRFDHYAVHYFIEHKLTGQVAGAARVIIAKEPYYEISLPFEQFCDPALNVRNNLFSHNNHVNFAEVSRMAVDANFRRRKGDSKHQSGFQAAVKPNEIMHRNFPLVSVGLFLGGASLAKLNNLQYLYCFMEPRLAQSLRRYGIHFQKSSEVTQYRGERAVYRIQPGKIFENIHPDLASFLSHCENSLAKQPCALFEERLNSGLRSQES